MGCFCNFKTLLHSYILKKAQETGGRQDLSSTEAGGVLRTYIKKGTWACSLAGLALPEVWASPSCQSGPPGLTGRWWRRPRCSPPWTQAWLFAWLQMGGGQSLRGQPEQHLEMLLALNTLKVNTVRITENLTACFSFFMEACD